MTQLDLGLVIPRGVAWWHREVWTRAEPPSRERPSMRINLRRAR